MPKIPPLPPMARLPKEPSPDSLRSFGPRPTLETLAPRGGEPATQVQSPSPSAYREQNPYDPPPAPRQLPSLLREHRRLAILFVGVAAAFALYCLQLPHASRSLKPPPPTLMRATAGGGSPIQPGPTPAPASDASASAPIYIESVPDQEKR